MVSRSFAGGYQRHVVRNWCFDFDQPVSRDAGSHSDVGRYTSSQGAAISRHNSNSDWKVSYPERTKPSPCGIDRYRNDRDDLRLEQIGSQINQLYSGCPGRNPWGNRIGIGRWFRSDSTIGSRKHAERSFCSRNVLVWIDHRPFHLGVRVCDCSGW